MSAVIDEFAEAIRTIIRSSRDEAEIARSVSVQLKNALSDERFMLGCLETAIVDLPPQLERWDNRPIVDDNEFEFSIRLIYWPASYANLVHRHSCWTVTGVFYNELTFRTFLPPAADTAEMTLDREYRGAQGEVGHIVPPCIHQVSNPSDRPSISIHIFSGPREERGEGRSTFERGQTIWYGCDHPPEPSQELTAQEVLGPMVEILRATRHESSLDLLDRLFAVADLPTRLDCLKALSLKDPVHAGRRAFELAEACHGSDAQELRRLADALVNG